MRMSARGWLVPAAVAAVAAGVGAWRMWPATARYGPIDSRAAYTEEEVAWAERASGWLRERAAAASPIASAAALAPTEAVEEAWAELAAVGLKRDDARAALEHGAALIHLLFVRRDFEACTRWREDHGYAFCPPARLRAEPMLKESVERVAGRALGDDEADGRDLWRLYWANGVERVPRVTTADQTGRGVIMLASRSAEGLAHRRASPLRRAAPSAIAGTPGGSTESRVGYWRGGQSATGWPMWFPPADVDARLQAPGVQFIEIGWVLGTEKGGHQPLVLVLGMDPATRRWWVMQWYLGHVERGVHLQAAGI